MNIQQFLEEHNEVSCACGTYVNVEDHNTNLINFVLSEAKERFRKLWASINKDNEHLTTEMIEDLIESEVRLAHQVGREEMRKEMVKIMQEKDKEWKAAVQEISDCAVEEIGLVAEEAKKLLQVRL